MEPGQRIRLRVINASGDTAYRIGMPGVPMTLTHTDGFPIVHRRVDAVVLAMGERVDALITVPDRPVPFVALAEGKTGSTFAVLAAGSGARPTMASVPKTLDGRVIQSASTTADPSVRLKSREVDVTHALMLTGSMNAYDWGINHRRYDENNPFAPAVNIKEGQRVRLDSWSAKAAPIRRPSTVLSQCPPPATTNRGGRPPACRPSCSRSAPTSGNATR